MDSWEDKIIWGRKEQSVPLPFPSPSHLDTLYTLRREPTFLDPLAPRNAEFERGDWLKSIIWNANQPYREFTRINLNLNDTQMLLEVHSGVGPGKFISILSARIPPSDPRLLLSRRSFGYSNDDTRSWIGSVQLVERSRIRGDERYEEEDSTDVRSPRGTALVPGSKTSTSLRTFLPPSSLVSDY